MSDEVVDYLDQNYDELKHQLLSQGKLFHDPHFSLEIPSSAFAGVEKLASSMKWVRPGELSSNPIFVGDITRFDLDQGSLGDCWFISATADFCARSKKMFDRVVVPHQSFKEGEYAGIFRFRFWRFGKWTEVVVDDLLPMCPNIVGKLLFCKNNNDPNEFWSCLIEKAYAKLHRDYAGIVGGQIQDALIDYTGGVSEVIQLKKPPADLFDLIGETLAMNSMLGCSINSTPQTLQDKLPNGLYEGHAYAVTGTGNVKDTNGQRHQLVRVRNPWGKGEWSGPWNDHSNEWQQVSASEKAKVGFEDKQDGEFWMSYDEWVTNFETLQMCHLSPDSITSEIANDEEKIAWKMTAHTGGWIEGQTAGGCGNNDQSLMWQNPQYHFEITDDHVEDGKAQAIISIMLKHHRFFPNIAHGYQLFEVKPGFEGIMTKDDYMYKMKAQIGTTKYGFNRESCKRWSLAPGNYVIIPTTFKPNQEAHFYLRIFTTKKETTLSHITHLFKL